MNKHLMQTKLIKDCKEIRNKFYSLVTHKKTLQNFKHINNSFNS